MVAGDRVICRNEELGVIRRRAERAYIVCVVTQAPGPGVNRRRAEAGNLVCVMALPSGPHELHATLAWSWGLLTKCVQQVCCFTYAGL